MATNADASIALSRNPDGTFRFEIEAPEKLAEKIYTTIKNASSDAAGFYNAVGVLIYRPEDIEHPDSLIPRRFVLPLR